METTAIQENDNLPFSQQDREGAWKRMIAKPKKTKAARRLESKCDEGLPFSRQDRERAWKHMISLGRKENKSNIPALP